MQFCTTLIAQLSLFLCKLVIHHPIHLCIFQYLLCFYSLDVGKNMMWKNKKEPNILFYDRTGTS